MDDTALTWEERLGAPIQFLYVQTGTAPERTVSGGHVELQALCANVERDAETGKFKRDGGRRSPERCHLYHLIQLSALLYLYAGHDIRVSTDDLRFDLLTGTAAVRAFKAAFPEYITIDSGMIIIPTIVHRCLNSNIMSLTQLLAKTQQHIIGGNGGEDTQAV